MQTNEYWEHRYRRGEGSGEGSRGEVAAWKARTVNALLSGYEAHSVVDWGCGDGVVAEQIAVEHYTGIDVSKTALELCREKMPQRTFLPYSSAIVRAEVALSLEVIFHIVDDYDYHEYMSRMFDSASRVVIIYSSSPGMHKALEANPAPHVRHRRFHDWVSTHQPHFYLTSIHRTPERFGRFSDFWVYEYDDRKRVTPR